MKATVIISYYKKIDYLKLVLDGIKKQSNIQFELIIAEDNNEIETINYINQYKKEVSFDVILIQQEDKGFRKNKILNEAIKKSTGEFLIFLDGDCIPHKKLVESYLKDLQSDKKYIYSGRRVMLSENLSKKLLKQSKVNHNIFLNILFSNSKHIEEGLYLPFSFIPKKKNKGLLGCNFGILKNDIMAINGFDEDYIKAGVGEDTDIEWRLLKLNFELYPMKFKAIVYHIDHSTNYSEDDVSFNTSIMNQKIALGSIKCTNGILKI